MLAYPYNCLCDDVHLAFVYVCVGSLSENVRKYAINYRVYMTCLVTGLLNFRFVVVRLFSFLSKVQVKVHN